MLDRSPFPYYNNMNMKNALRFSGRLQGERQYMIGIIVAMKAEAAEIKAAMTDKQTRTQSGIEFVSGRFCGKDVVVAQSGVGKVFAAVCAQTMILTYHPTYIINTGVGGTLTPSLSIGDIAIASDVVQHDMDTSAVGDPVGMISGLNIIHIPADATLAKLAEKAASQQGFPCLKGTVSSGDQFVSTAPQKERIRSLFHAIACEMEGAAIGHVCYINSVPFTVLRTISDNADDSSGMDYSAFLPLAISRSFLILSDVIRQL